MWRHPLQASGFVIAREGRVPEQGGLLACSCSSSKLPGRAPAGRVLLRAFYRPDGTCPISTNDGIWVRRALEDLALTLGIHGRPVRSWVARWPNAFSRNDRDLRVSAERLAGALCHRRHIQLAGSAFFGAGALPAMESGRRAARRLLGIQAACAEFDESQVRPGTRDAST
jgi:oxygen-dependent protoporphyrinogen oxidase